jgi:hypothetical protein
MVSHRSLHPHSHLELTNAPYGEREQEGAASDSDHERPDRESESALTGRVSHECLGIAPGDEITVNYRAELPLGLKVIVKAVPGTSVVAEDLLEIMAK